MDDRSIRIRNAYSKAGFLYQKTKKNTMKRFFISTLVFFLLVTTASAFLFEDPDDTFYLDEYLITEQDEISDYDPDAHLLENRTQRNLLDDSIDPERDLDIHLMENIIFLAIVFVAIMFLVGVIVTIKKFSGLALIFVLAVLVLAGTAVIFGLSNNTNFITQMMYGDDEELWGNLTIEDFQVNELNDLPLQYNHEKTLQELNDMVSIPRTMEEDILDIQYYNWQNTRDKRELLAIEFIDNTAVRNFVEIMFKPQRKLEIQKEDAYLGILNGAETEYQNPYLVEENRFVFLVFGPELYSDNAIEKIVEYYPQQYQYNKDDTAPRVTFLQPNSPYTNTNNIEFIVADTESGLNPLGVTLLNIDTVFDPLMDCTKNIETNYDEYRCSIENGLDIKSNSFIVLAADRENNNFKDTVYYVYDDIEPEITITETVDTIVFEVEDNNNLSPSSIILQSGSKLIATQNYCSPTTKSIVCTIDAERFLGQGKNTFTISVTDEAGNTKQESVTTIIDTIDPIVTYLSAQSNYTNNDVAEFMVIDGESGIKEIQTKVNGKRAQFCTKLTDKRYVCRYELGEEENIFEFTVEDGKGNTIEESFTILSDFTSPEITILDFEQGLNGFVSFRIFDAKSGINLEEIAVDGNIFFVEDICERRAGAYDCYYQLELGSVLEIVVEDNAGNMQDFEQSITT
jgi:hypothetical protein